MLTIRKVANYLHVVPRTVYRMSDRQDLPAVKVGRVWPIRRQDLETYLNRSTSRPRNEEVKP